MANDKLIIDYAMKNDARKDFFHSSAYGNAQNSGSIGTAGGDSFSVRQSIEKNRQHVKKYKSSKVANQFYNAEYAKSYSHTDDLQQMSNRRDAYATNREAINADSTAQPTRYTNAGDSLADRVADQRVARLRGRNSASNPMDVAMKRARFSTSGGITSAGSDVARRAQPILSNARAPQVPTRRSGI
ncbi:hypothetical protein IKG12_00975 [Candidatus Saccharibacteria bacterium]|nr:hypothetical protein [Candidatus Saccharibacteria bacterium]